MRLPLPPLPYRRSRSQRLDAVFACRLTASLAAAAGDDGDDVIVCSSLMLPYTWQKPIHALLNTVSSTRPSPEIYFGVFSHPFRPFPSFPFPRFSPRGLEVAPQIQLRDLGKRCALLTFFARCSATAEAMRANTDCKSAFLLENFGSKFQ